jgi:hypothetical protein
MCSSYISIIKLEMKASFCLLTGDVEQQPCWVIMLEVCSIFDLFQFHLSDKMLLLEFIKSKFWKVSKVECTWFLPNTAVFLHVSCFILIYACETCDCF